MLKETKIFELLKGYRNKTIYDPEKFARTISEISQWVYDKENLKELEINPLIVNENGPHVIDLRMNFD